LTFDEQEMPAAVSGLGLFGPFDSAQDRVCLGLNWPIRLRSGQGLNWVCFHQVSNCEYFHKPFAKRYLHSFGHTGNWVCFAKKGLICRESSTDVVVAS